MNDRTVSHAGLNWQLEMDDDDKLTIKVSASHDVIHNCFIAGNTSEAGNAKVANTGWLVVHNAAGDRIRVNLVVMGINKPQPKPRGQGLRNNGVVLTRDMMNDMGGTAQPAARPNPTLDAWQRLKNGF